MRILLLTFYYPPDIGPGPLRAQSIQQALRDVGPSDLKIDVLTTMPNRYHTISTEALSTEHSPLLSINRFSLPTHKSGMIDQSKAFIAYARAVLRAARGSNWDIVVATSSRLMTAALGALVARRCGARLYLDIRDLFTDTMQDVLAGSPFRFLLPAFRSLERYTFQTANGINVVSAGFLPHLKDVAPKISPTIFTNGIDEEFLDRPVTPDTKRSVPLILYAGNLGEGQGLHNILPEAASRMSEQASFRLIGDGGRRKSLEDRISQEQLTNIEIYNPVARTELLKEYHNADVLFLHLNDYQAFRKVLPSKIFEYAATGKPILAGVGGYAAEFLRKHVQGTEVFEPCNAEAMTQALKKLLSGPKEIDRSEFCARYMRKNIMLDMASDILSLSKLPEGVR